MRKAMYIITNKFPKNKKNIEFESQMDDRFGDDPTIVPVVTASSRKSNDNNSSRAEGSESENLDDSPDLSTPKRQRKMTSTVVDLLQDFIGKAQKSKEEELNRRKRMHRENLVAINRLVEIIKNKTINIKW